MNSAARFAANSAGTGVPTPEDQSEIEKLRTMLFDCYQPANEIELALLDDLAVAWYRQKGLLAQETAFFFQCMNEMMQANADMTLNEALGNMFASDAHTKKLTVWLRYQSSIERAYQRALTALSRAQKDRKSRAQNEADIMPSLPKSAPQKPATVQQQPAPGATATSKNTPALNGQVHNGDVAVCDDRAHRL